MYTPAARNQGHAGVVPAVSGKPVFQFYSDGDDSLALAFALQAVAHGLGCELDVDDLTAALGLPFITCAVLGEEDLTCWPLYVRDAFLVEAAGLFGMSIRAVHPPSAAFGLERAPEFHGDPSSPDWRQNAFIRGLRTLPLRFPRTN